MLSKEYDEFASEVAVSPEQNSVPCNYLLIANEPTETRKIDGRDHQGTGCFRS
jgi:hypothetical protein